MDEVMARERSELSAIWWSLAERQGALPDHYPVVALQAELVFSMTRGAISALVYRQFSNNELVIAQLCSFIDSGVRGQLQQLRAALSRTI